MSTIQKIALYIIGIVITTSFISCLIGCGESLESAPIESCTQVFTQSFCDSITGTQGKEGINGQQGETGRDGDSGTNGLTGNDGEQGIQGIQGIQGTQGTNGTIGAMGPQGERGNQGEQGEIGPQGNDGKECWVECLDKQTILITCPTTIVQFKGNKCIDIENTEEITRKE